MPSEPMHTLFLRRRPERPVKPGMPLWRLLVSGISSLIVLLCLLNTGLAHLAEKPDAVLNHLAKVDVFAFGGIGFAGTISPGEKDYLLILSRPSAESDFETLLGVGNSQAKCYALAGLRQVNPERFKKLTAGLWLSQAEVSTMSGCLMRRQTISAVLKQIQAGNYVRQP